MRLKLSMFIHYLEWKDLKKGIRTAIRSAWKDAVWAYNFHNSKKEKPDFSEEDIYL